MANATQMRCLSSLLLELRGLGPYLIWKKTHISGALIRISAQACVCERAWPPADVRTCAWREAGGVLRGQPQGVMDPLRRPR